MENKMNIEEMIKVMEHYRDGGEVEFSETGFDDWGIANDPCWNWVDYNYRIKETKPKVTIEKWLIKDVDSGEYFIMESSDVDLTLKAFPNECKVKLIASYEVEL